MDSITAPSEKSPGMRTVTAARWEAIARRDRRADGRFVYAVKTTGVFCRPSCGSRLPRRENVETFATPAAAERAGYRACLRCRPADDACTSPRLARACRMLASDEPSVRCRDVAAALSMTPASLSRLFREELGVSPRAYRLRVLAERAKGGLAKSASVTDALYTSGYSSPSRFYASASTELGMPPARARAGGTGERISFVVRACSLGRVLVAWTAKGVCDVALGDDDEALVAGMRARFPRASIGKASAPPWLRDVLRIVDGEQTTRDVPLDLRGTAFQERVWRALRTIAHGETRTYEELARELGVPRAARAVARACATNAVAILVPCHRVVRKGGAISGYRWGVDRKRVLLERESLAAAKRDRVDGRSRA